MKEQNSYISNYETGFKKTLERSIIPEVGMVATVNQGTDRVVYDVVGLRGKTIIVLRAREAILVEKPEMQVGGFAGIVTKKAVWKTQPDLNGEIREATYRKEIEAYKIKGFTLAGSMYHYGNVDLDKDQYYYDYEF